MAGPYNKRAYNKKPFSKPKGKEMAFCYHLYFQILEIIIKQNSKRIKEKEYLRCLGKNDTIGREEQPSDRIFNEAENKLDTILAFVKFVLYEESEINNSLLSEPSLVKDWLNEEEDATWENL